MAWRFGAFLVLLGCVLTACATSEPEPTLSPSPERMELVDCGDLAPDLCGAAAEAVAATVLRQGAVIHVELGRGVWCPTPGLLFANTTCPGGGLPPAAGGQWIGHGLVTFAGLPALAYVNLARDAGGVHGTLIAIATPPPEPSAP